MFGFIFIPQGKGVQHKQRLEVVWGQAGSMECYKQCKTLPGALWLPLFQAQDQDGMVSLKGMEGGTGYRTLVTIPPWHQPSAG